MQIRVGEAGLAECRFAISPLLETHAALRLLTGAAGHASVLEPWARRMRPQLAVLRRAVPVIGALAALYRTTDNADFLHPPPTGPHGAFDDELDGVRATPLSRARAELDRNLAGHRTPPEYAQRILAGPDVVDRLADALEAVWQTLIQPEWPRLRAVLERDIMQRAGGLATSGWAAALAGLHPRVSWDDGVLTVRRGDGNVYEVGGRGLLLVPTVFADLGLTVEPPLPVTILYRARGVGSVLGGPSAVASDDALVPLLGRGRAAVLRALAAPATTSQLVLQLDLGLGTVGGHLAVLRRAGLVQGTRTGRSVTYQATALGLALLSGDL